MRVSIKRVSISSAAKIGCLMSALPIICMATASIVLLTAPTTAFSPSLQYQLRVLGGSASAMILAVLYALGVGLVAAIGWGLAAFIYNIVSMLFGGLEISLRREDTPVSASVPKPPPEPATKRKPSSPDGVNWYDLNHDEKELIRKRRAQQGDYDVSRLRAEDGSFPGQWDKSPKKD